MKLYTRTGDHGETGLQGGLRVAKDCRRVTAYGEVDELNAALGWCRVSVDATLAQRLEQIQSMLFVIGAELSTDPGQNQSAGAFVSLDDAEVGRLEQWIDEASAQVPAARHFILPGGCEAGARLHLARTVCRRAERAVVTLAAQETCRPVISWYMNRLSDLLFAWARLANDSAGHPEVPWAGPKSQS